jgi:heptosyltransferase-1
VIACDLRRWRKAPFAQATRHEWSGFKSELQRETYDAVIDLQGLTKSALVSWLSRTAAHGRRFSLANQTEGSSFEAPARWVADATVEVQSHVHAVQRSRILSAAALRYEFSGPARYGLAPGNKAATVPVALHLGQTLNSFEPRKPVVALVHGTSRADKQWSEASWIALGQRLNHSGFSVAIAHGNAVEKAVSERIAAQLQEVWLWPSMGLDALTDTMSRCAGVIGVDSGLSHIAVALDLPHVQIYNFDTAWRTGPEMQAAKTQRQLSVFASPEPTLEQVWSAWESLATPVLCR